MKLSAVIIAKNEAHNIAACLDSLSFCDEIIVVDDMSTDDTVTLAEQAGARVFRRALDGDFAGQQNFGIAQAGGDWVLFVDCDERITPALAAEIQTVIAQPACAYRIRRLNHFAGQRVRFGTLRVDSVCRLAPRQNLAFTGRVHQHLTHDFEEKTLKAEMLHYTYSSWQQYYQKFEHYTRLAARQYHEQGRRAHFGRDCLLRPLWAFLKMYVFHGGFLDGRIGWLLAVNHYYYTLVKYARLYSMQHYGEEVL